MRFYRSVYTSVTTSPSSGFLDSTPWLQTAPFSLPPPWQRERELVFPPLLAQAPLPSQGSMA